MASFLYPSAAQQHPAAGSSKAAAAAAVGKAGGSGSNSTASMPTQADFNELLALLHGRAAAGEGSFSAGVASAAAAAAAVAGGSVGIEATAAGAAAAAAAAAGSTSSTLRSPSPAPAASAGAAIPEAAIASRSTSTSAPARLAPAISLNWQLLRLRAVLQDCPKRNVRKELVVVDLEGTSIQGSLRGSRLSAQLQLQEFRFFDCCSDPGVHECILQRLQPGSPVAALGGTTLSPTQGWGSGLTGLGLSQGEGLHKHSPEVFGWSGTAMPAVSSSAGRTAASGARQYAATSSSSAAAMVGAGGMPAAAATGCSGLRVLKQPLFSVGIEMNGSSKHVSVQLEQLQLLARPGCIVGVLGMLQQVPTDTLQQQLRAAAADIKAAHEAAAPDAASTSNRQQQQVQVPAELLRLQLSLRVHELLVVLPTELQYAAGLNAVVHLQGFRLNPTATAAQSPTGAFKGTAACSAADGGEEAGPAQQTMGSTAEASALNLANGDAVLLEAFSADEAVVTRYQSSASSGSSSTTFSTEASMAGAAGAIGSTPGRRKAVQQACERQAVQQHQQQYTLEMAMLSVGVHQPDPTVGFGSNSHVAGHIHLPLQELLKLPALSGTVTVTSPAGTPAAEPIDTTSGTAADGSTRSRGRASQHTTAAAAAATKLPPSQQQQLPLVKLGLQLPPVSCTISTSLLSALKEFAAAVKFQVHLPLADLVACYHVSCDKQPAIAAAAAARRHQQRQLLLEQVSSSSGYVGSSPGATVNRAAEAAAADAGEEERVGRSEPPSPTNSDIERWMAAPSSMQAAAAAAGLDDFCDYVYDDQEELHHRWNACHPAAATAGSSAGSSNSGLTAAAAAPSGSSPTQQQQLKRCDSDRLLQSMSLSPVGIDGPLMQQQQQPGAADRQGHTLQRQRQQQPQRQTPGTAAVAAAVLAFPDMQLFEVELLLEELDVQYVQDLPLGKQGRQRQQQQQQAAGLQQASSTGSISIGRSSPELHLRLQASLLHVHFRHSTHGSRANVALNNLVLQDVLPAPGTADPSRTTAAGAAAAAAPPAVVAADVPDLKRLLSHVLLDQLQLSWCSQLRSTGVQQDVQVALLGLQAQVSSACLDRMALKSPWVLVRLWECGMVPITTAYTIVSLFCGQHWHWCCVAWWL